MHLISARGKIASAGELYLRSELTMDDSEESGTRSPYHWEPESSWSYYSPFPPYLGSESHYCNRVGVPPGSHAAEGFDVEVLAVIVN